MGGHRLSHTSIIAFISGVISFVMIIIHEAVRHVTGSPIMIIDWAANVLIVATSLYIRFHIDETRYIQAVTEAVPEERPIYPLRFINFMPAAMFFGLAAEITLHYYFIPGMLLYLAMQALLIISLTGILPLQFEDYRSGPSAWYYRAVTVLWLVMPILLFFCIIYNELKSLVVIPYILFLSVMTIMAYLAFTCSTRPMLFRLAPVIASTSFIVSDLFVGYVAFNRSENNYYIIISMTYIITVLLFNSMILFLKTKRGEYVVS